MVITEPAEPSAQLLGLGSKQYSSNMQRMFNEDFYSISHVDYFQVRKIEHASERKAASIVEPFTEMLEGPILSYCEHDRKQAKTCYYFMHKSVSN